MGRSPLQRVRQVLVATVTLATLLVSLATVTSLYALKHEEDRITARTPVVSGTPTALRLDTRWDAWRGTSYPMVWLQWAEPDPQKANQGPAGQSPPPGIPAGATPGWYLSPGLMALRQQHEELRMRFPNAHRIAREGVTNHAELFAYRLAPPSARLGVNTVHVARFGCVTGRPGQQCRELEERTEYEIVPMVAAATGLVGLPLMLALAVAVTAGAQVRRKRLAMLNVLGLPRRGRIVLTVTETLVLALPGTAAAVAAWAVLSRQLASVPLVGRPVDGRDLDDPLLIAATTLAQLTLIVVVAAGHSFVGRRQGPRPVPAPKRPSSARALPLLAGLALIMVAQTRDGKAATSMTLFGILATATTLPLAFPALIGMLGRRLRKSQDPAVLLAGGRLAHDPSGAVRHMIGIAALLVITPTVLTWLSLANQTDPPAQRDPQVNVVGITGPDGQHLDVAATGAGGLVVRSLTENLGDRATPSSAPPVLRLALDCPRLTGLLGAPACQANGTELTPPTLRRLSDLLNTEVDPKLTRSGKTDPNGFDVLIPRTPGGEDRLRAVLLNGRTSVTLYGEAELAQHRSPLVAWILGGLLTLAALITLVLIGGLIDRTAGARPYLGLVTALGVTPKGVRRLQTREQLTAFAAVCGSSLALGVLISRAWYCLDASAPYPLAGIITLGTVTALLGAIVIKVSTAATSRGQDPPYRQT